MNNQTYTGSDRDIEIQKMIEEYIRGKLPCHKVDLLWIEFLRVPKWYNYFLTELHLTALFSSRKGEKSDFVSP